MLVRSARTCHACNFQDMWKRKSARRTTSRNAFTERNMTKTQGFSPRYLSGAKIFGYLSHSTELVRMCLVVNTLTSAAPIVITGDVRGGGTRDEPQRTSAWKDRRTRDEVCEGFGATTRTRSTLTQWLSINILSSNSQVFLQLSDA